MTNVRNAATLFTGVSDCGISNDKIARAEGLVQNIEEVANRIIEISANSVDNTITEKLKEWYHNYNGAISEDDFLEKCDLVLIDIIMSKLKEMRDGILDAIKESQSNCRMSIMDQVRESADQICIFDSEKFSELLAKEEIGSMKL